VTLAGVTQGIMMIDSRGSLSVSNQRAMNLLHLPEQTWTASAALESVNRVIDRGRPISAGLSNPSASDCQILESVMDDGQVIEVRTTPLADGEKIHTLTDITEQHRAQSHIRYMAHHDALTGLPNRALLEEKISAALTQAAATGRQVLVMFIDLDSFKGVNDTLGHLIGDLLLKHVAEVIGSAIGPHDFVARLGGDEFIVVRSEVEDAGTAAELANLLIDCISDSVIIEDHELRVSTSIGISVFPRDGVDHHVLFKKADIALYRAKAEGRATYRIFESGMDERLHRRLMLEEDLRHALETETLQVHFQPQFESSTLRLAGFEALARWHHPKHGWVSPEVFIAVAEEAGLIVRLGAFVLERSCEQAMQWPSDCFIAVNVSAIQLLDASFLGQLKDILARTGLPAHRLELELTESVMTDSGRQTVSTLNAVRELGIGLALDDFGTGYSSLSNLLRFRFDKVKIDRSFIQEQHRDSEARAILEAILAMSRHIGLKVTAEGVETEAQLAMLKRQGCTLIQGYLLGRAVPGRETLELFAGRPGFSVERPKPIPKLLVATDTVPI
jgi:diguanylate cyclase (GGDEF)-like protein